MNKIKIIKMFSIITLSVVLSSCNVEYKKQVELGAMSWCELKSIQEQLKNTPDDIELIEQRERLLRRVETHEELSGDVEQYRLDIRALSQDC